jgi:hypothetical protein
VLHRLGIITLGKKALKRLEKQEALIRQRRG